MSHPASSSLKSSHGEPKIWLCALGLTIGLGMTALLLMLMDIIAKLLIRYARLHFRLFDTANKSI